MNVRTHVGGLHGKTSYDWKKDKAEMELTAMGVLVKSMGGKPMANPERFYLLLPLSNCTEILVEGSDELEEEPKRGPGRPPGQKD